MTGAAGGVTAGGTATVVGTAAVVGRLVAATTVDSSDFVVAVGPPRLPRNMKATTTPTTSVPATADPPMMIGSGDFFSGSRTTVATGGSGAMEITSTVGPV